MILQIVSKIIQKLETDLKKKILKLSVMFTWKSEKDDFW